MEKLFYNMNKTLLTSIDQNFYGLSNGKMGLCIYFYHLSKLENNYEYVVIAEKLLNEVLENINLYSPVNVNTGLAGIAIGVNHLLKENFLEGDVNEILEDIDNVIFKVIVFESDSLDVSISEYIYMLYYLYIRYVEQEDYQKYISKGLIIKVIDYIYQKLTPDFFNEPSSFSSHYHLPVLLFIIGKIISLNIYNARIYKILDEFKLKILGSFPLLHSNRLFLLWGLTELNLYYPGLNVNENILLLKGNIDLNKILHQELTNKQIFVKNGVSLVYILLSQIENINESKIDFDPTVIYDRIFNSEAWDADKWGGDDYYYGLLSGLPGAILTLSFIRKNIGYEA